MIVREMHIVQTIRFKIGVNTVVNVEGIVTVQKPFHVLYKVCSEGSLMEYLKAHVEDVQVKEKFLVSFFSLLFFTAFFLAFTRSCMYTLSSL